LPVEINAGNIDFNVFHQTDQAVQDNSELQFWLADNKADRRDIIIPRFCIPQILKVLSQE